MKFRPKPMFKKKHKFSTDLDERFEGDVLVDRIENTHHKKIKGLLIRIGTVILLYTSAVLFFKPPKVVKKVGFEKHNFIADSLTLSYDNLNTYNQVTFDGDIMTAVYVLTRGDKTIYCVGVQHVGEKEYFNTLKRMFLDNSDVVLYECINLREGSKKDVKAAHYEMEFRKELADIMGLMFQTEFFDYNNPDSNWIHADISISPSSKEFKKYFLTPDEYKFTLLSRYILIPFFRSQKFFYTLAGMKNEYEASFRAFCIPSEDYSWVDGSKADLDRENMVFQKIDSLLSDDNVKKISIFYGYAHMPRIIDKLVSVYGFKPKKQYWIVSTRIQSLLND